MSQFKKYMEIIQEMKVDKNKFTGFLKKFSLTRKILNKKASESIKSESSIDQIKKLLQSEHVQNNHFTWNNSGSKYLISPEQIIKEIGDSELRPKGKITTLGPTGKEFKSQLVRIIAKNNVGKDYSMSKEQEDEAVNFYNNHKDIIDKAFNNIKQGLEYAMPIKKNGEIIYYLEKRHGNPFTKFFLKVGKGKETNIINLIPNGQGGWFTSYPGIPPKVIDFSKPACLLIDSANRVKNTKAIIIEFEKAMRMSNIQNLIDLISQISKDADKFPKLNSQLGFKDHDAEVIKKELPSYTKNINYLIKQYPEIKKDLQSAGYSGDKLINQFLNHYKEINKDEKEKINWFYENFINKNSKIKIIFNS